MRNDGVGPPIGYSNRVASSTQRRGIFGRAASARARVRPDDVTPRGLLAPVRRKP